MTQDAAQPDPLVGQTVANKYKVVKLLGEGGMGAVYQAEQQLGTNTRKVALKTLHKHLSHDASIKARFNREAGTVAALEHPNTIQVFDFGEMADGTLYLVMEFVQGRSVADILEKDGAMPPARVENIMRQVCGSLEEAHNHGIVHRDLKPDNVVLTERAGQKDWVEVLDFGIAKRSSEHDPNEAKLTQQGMVLGTPPYMSPEQFTGQPVDLRSDIYALGIMAYEMLTGAYPFEANTAWEWASKHMTEQPRPIETQRLGPNVPEKMRQAITRALAKNKDERFGSVKEFFEALSSGTGPMPQQSVAPNFPHQAGTAMMQGSPGHGSMPDASAPTSGGAGPEPRAKTEMGQPMAPPGAMGGGFGPPPGGPSMPGVGMGGGGAPAAIPPAHSAPQQPQKGGAPVGIIVGLLGLAVVIIGAAVYFGVIRKGGKTVVVDPSLASAAVSATASVADMADAAAPVPTESAGTTPEVTPLTPTSGTTAANTTAPTHTTAPKASAKPPPKTDPESCKSARRAKAMNSPMAARLEIQCRNDGGHL